MAIVKEIFLAGGAHTMKIPSQDVFDQVSGTRLVAVDETSDTEFRDWQCERRLRHEERCLHKGIMYHLNICEWIGERPIWIVNTMDYRGRIYPCTSILNYLGADPVRGVFKFKDARKLGGKQPDGFTGFEWLLIHVVIISEKKTKATQEELGLNTTLLP